MKQIVSLFKEKSKKSNESFSSIKDPFLCLNIVCPRASYDPNIEPIKEDVLFEDGSKVISAVTELFTAIYPVQEDDRRRGNVPPTLHELEIAPNPEAVTPPQFLQRQISPQMTKMPERQPAEALWKALGDDVALNDEELNFLERSTSIKSTPRILHRLLQRNGPVLLRMDFQHQIRHLRLHLQHRWKIFLNRLHEPD